MCIHITVNLFIFPFSFPLLSNIKMETNITILCTKHDLKIFEENYS